MQLFDNAMRELGGFGEERPSWETTPANFPVKTLPWAAFMDASDNAFLVKTGSDVYKWRSAVFHPTPIAGVGAFRFTGFAQGTYPTIGGGTANPAGSQHISFDGVSQYFRSGALNQMGQRWNINTYSSTEGGGGNEGLWVSDTTTYSFSQATPAQVPDLSGGGPRADRANSDYLTSNATLNDLFPGGTSGTITLALYAESSVAPVFGTNIAQSPWANPAFMMDNSGYLGVHFTTSGITVGAYDGVARDSGGGPGTNDGWQMVTAALATSTSAIVQVRWGAGTTLLELRVITSAGWGAWQTCAFSAIGYTAGTVQLFTEYSTSVFHSGLIYEMATSPSRLDDVYADEDVRYTAAHVGIDISLFNTVIDDAPTLFGDDAADGQAHGYETFLVGRANDRTTTSNAYAAKSFWQTSGDFVGLASITNGGQARWAPNLADNTGGANFQNEIAIANDTWALMSSRLDNGKLISRKNGDPTTEVSAALTTAAPNTTGAGQSLNIGYSIGAADYFTGAMSFIGFAATQGWSAARRRDVERWLNKTYLTSAGGTTYTRTPSDTLAASDALARSATYGRKPTVGALASSDALARSLTYGRKPTVDTLVETESVARAMTYGRKPTVDALGIAESVLPSSVRARVINETALGSTESIARTMTYGRKPSTDSLVETEGFARTMTYGRKPLENVVLTESLTETAVRARTMSDALVETESIARSMTYGRKPTTDALGTTDGQLRSLVYGRTLSDTAVLVEALTSTKTFGRAMVDSLVLTEALSRTVTYGRKPSEACGLSDGISSAKTISRSAGDTCAASETIARTMTYGRKPGDTCATTESVTRSVAYGRALSDTCLSTDALVRSMTYGRTLSDGVGASESFTREVTYGRTLAENPALVDALTFQAFLSISITLSDTLALVEGLGVEADYERSLSDTVGMLDGIDPLLLRLVARNISDAIDVSDGFSSEASYARRSADVAALTESIAKAASYARSAGDTLATSDALKRVHTMHRIVNETIGTIDGLGYDLAGIIVRTMGDSVALVDVLSRVHTTVRTAGDTLAATDSARASRERAYVLSDALSSTDSVQRALAFGRTFLDIAVVEDAALREINFERSTYDDVPLSDAARASFDFARAPGDIVALDETFDGRFVFIGVERVREIRETIKLVDSVRAELHRIEAGYISFGDKLVTTGIDFGDLAAATTIIIGAVAPATEISIMSYSEGFDVGDVAEIPFTVRKKRTGVLTTPDTLRVLVQPGRNAATFAIVFDGVDGRLVEDDVGEYRMLLPCTAAGDWTVQVETTGEAAAIQPTRFKVREPLLSL